MIITTTDSVQGREVAEYLGVIGGDAIVGANIFKDFFGAVRDIVGGRAGAYEKTIRDAKRMAFEDLEEKAREIGADAVVAIDIDYEVLGKTNGMLMVSVNGTAVRFK